MKKKGKLQRGDDAAGVDLDPREVALFRRTMAELDVVAAKPPPHAAPSPRESFVAAIESPDDLAMFEQAMAQLGVVSGAAPAAATAAKTPTARTGERSPSPENSTVPAVPARQRASDAIDPREAATFRQAMEALDAVPDKDTSHARDGLPADFRIPRMRTPRADDLQVDDTVDLHGLRVEDAIGVLSTLLPQAKRDGSRAVRVVTGKGHHSRDGVGVLRDAVEHWIAHHGGRWLRGYAQAPRALGGGGAFVLFVQR